MLPTTTEKFIPSDLKKRFDQAILNSKNFLSSLINNPSDSILSTIKKAFKNKHSTRQELISCISEIFSIQANFPTYATSRAYPIIEQATRIKGIMTDPKLVPYKKLSDKCISQKTSTEAVWVKDLQDYYSSIDAYIQSINISIALISIIKNQISDNLEYIQIFLSKIDQIHANPDTGPIHTKAKELQAYNKIRSDIDNIQTEFLKIQKTLPQYSKALSAEITRSAQDISQLNNFMAYLPTKTTLSQAMKTIKTFKLRTNDYRRFSQTNNNPLLSDISQKSDVCLSLEEQLKNSKSPIVKQIEDFNKHYTKNLTKSNAVQDKTNNDTLEQNHTLLDLMKSTPKTVSTLDKTTTLTTPLIQQFIGTKDKIISVKDGIDRIHQHPNTGFFHTAAKEKVEYNKLNSLLMSYASLLDDNVRECEDILNQTQQLKNNFSSYLDRINYLKVKQETIKDLQQQITAINKSISDDTKQATALFDKVHQIPLQHKKIQDNFYNFSTQQMISDYRSHYK